MFRSILWRISLPLITVIVIGMTVLGVYLVDSVREAQLGDLRAQLEMGARLTAEVAAAENESGLESLDAVADRLGERINARVTIIAPDGTVLGDSEEDPALMDNHANRPEVIAALASGVGESTRFSITLGTSMMYVAVPVSAGGRTVGIARVALPLTAVEEFANRATMGVVLAVAVTAVAAGAAAWLVTRLMTRSLRDVTAAARRLAAGQLGQTIPVRSADEAGDLARAFNEMSARLRQQVDGISAERGRLASVLGNMTDGVIMTDGEGYIVLANRAAGRLLDFQQDKSVGRTVIEAVQNHEVHELLTACLGTRREQAAQLVYGVSRRFLRCIAIPIGGEKPGGCLLLFQDLTEVRALQTMRRELVGNVSHELRTPMAAIKAMVETLQSGAIDDRPAALDFLGRIDDEIDRLTQMAAELTELSRIETGKANLTMQPVDLSALATGVLTQMRPLAEKSGVSLSSRLAADLPVVDADQERIRQTLVNLVHNAIKFNRWGGSVTVTAVVEGDHVSIAVADTGIGISRDDLPHVFERFYKADRSRGGGGSGLGLAIAKHTVTAHGGIIGAASEVGKGSTFTFTLPLSSGT